jgi:protein-L-isoaspartate(D-aspartate) O-methyltransferase
MIRKPSQARRNRVTRGLPALIFAEGARDVGRCDSGGAAPDATAAAVYHDALIAYDEQRRLNNGLPCLWAFVFDKLLVACGERVLHLGRGMGYYTAVLAELVRLARDVSAVEIDEPLAERAREALTPWPLWSQSSMAKGGTLRFAESDVVVVSAGATHPLPAWPSCLNPNGRLVLPMTVTIEGAACCW